MGLSACSSSTSEPTTETPTQSLLDCEREGYPCSLADVPQAVMDSSLAALEDAYEALDSGDLSDARALLEARSDLVDIVSDDNAIRFRLEGGMPVWLLDVSGVTDEPPRAAPASHPRADSVVGEDTNGDDDVNNRDIKRALVMAPYLWDFEPFDESPVLATTLGSLPAYDGNVRYVGNPEEGDQNVTLEDWRNWNQYDTIFVSSHGARIERDDRDLVAVLSGIEFDVTEHLESIGVMAAGAHDDDADRSNLIVEYAMTRDFFQNAYGSGLDNAFVSFSACETGAGGASDLASALGADDFVMMGWSEVVPTSLAFNALGAFTEHMALGLRAEEALDRLREDGLDQGPNSDGVTTVYTRFAPGGGDQRLIEVPTILDEAGQPLVDGTNVADMLDGLAGDGDPDALTVTSRLAGIEEDTEGEYGVRYELRDQSIGTGYGLMLAERLDPSTVEVEHIVELGRDAPTALTELKMIVDLPEGGESEYVADVSFGSECHWTMSFSGPDHSGGYDGSMGNVLRGPPTTMLLSREGNVFPGITLFFPERLPTTVPATLRLGLSGSANPENQDGILEIGFDDVTYMSGDGSPCCTPTDPQDTFPSPLTMVLEVNDADRVEGTINGQVWAFAPDGGLPLRKASVQIDFTVTASGNCQIVDPLDP